MSPDPENASAEPGNPQSWNAYAYVNDNPLNATDPDGLDPDYCDQHPDNCAVVHGDPPILFSLVDVQIGRTLQHSSQTAVDYLHSAWQAVVKSRVGCTAAWTLGGALAGGTVGAQSWGAAGAAGGALLGFAGGPAAPATVPAGAATGGTVGAIAGGVVGGIGGGAAGFATGQALCSSGAGNGGGGGGSTKHGAERKAERGWTPEEIAETKTGTKMTQADGASVFVKGIGRGKYNVIVEGEGGFVTGMEESLVGGSTGFGTKLWVALECKITSVASAAIL